MSSIIIELKRRLEDLEKRVAELEMDVPDYGLEKRVAELEMDVPDYGYDIPIPETPREREERIRRESEAWEERERTKNVNAIRSNRRRLAQSGIKRGRGRPRGSRNGQ